MPTIQAEFDFNGKFLQLILPLLFIFYTGSKHNVSIPRLYYLPTCFSDIAFHFIIPLQVLSFLTVNTYNQRSVVSALVPTSKQDSMTASRDYMMFTWCLWRFLIQFYCTLRDWFWSIAPPPIAECMYEMEICRRYPC